MSRDAENKQTKLVDEPADTKKRLSSVPSPSPNDLAHLGSPFAHIPAPADLIDLWDETDRFFDALGDPSDLIEPEDKPAYKVEPEPDPSYSSNRKPVKFFDDESINSPSKSQLDSKSQIKNSSHIQSESGLTKAAHSSDESILSPSIIERNQTQRHHIKEEVIDQESTAVVQAQSNHQSAQSIIAQTRSINQKTESKKPKPSLAERFTQRHKEETAIIVIAGGKGGSGRSLLCANLAITLSNLASSNVGVVDLDPIGATLHTYLGLDPLMDVPGKHLRGKVKPISEQVPHTKVILTRSTRALCTPYTDTDRRQTLETAQALNPKWLIIDIGNLHDAFTLDLFVNAHFSLIVYTPDPCGFERSHCFLQAALYRQLIDKGDEASVIAKSLLSADHEGLLTGPTSLARSLRHVHPEACDQLEARIQNFKPLIVVNGCRTQTDRVTAEEICSVLKRKWRIMPQALGTISHHHVAHQSLLERRPLTLAFPSSSIALDIEKLTRELLKQERTESILINSESPKL